MRDPCTARQSLGMSGRTDARSYLRRLLGAALVLAPNPLALKAEPSQAATLAFQACTAAVEHRLAMQHAAGSTFLAGADDPRLRRGELVLEPVSEPGCAEAGAELPGAMLHHWRGTAFVPGAHAAEFQRLLRDLPHYPERFAPEVLQAAVLRGDSDHLEAAMRVRQHHGITVVLDTAYEIGFGRLDERHGYSVSRSTRIAEVAAPGTRAEHALSPADEHGFLWRLNTYWSWEECDGGVYLQVETVSLSRAIPQGLGWMLRPYVESIPRESLAFTLRSAAAALRH